MRLDRAGRRVGSRDLATMAGVPLRSCEVVQKREMELEPETGLLSASSKTDGKGCQREGYFVKDRLDGLEQQVLQTARAIKEVTEGARSVNMQCR